MSVHAMTAVFSDSRTSGNERLMLLAIADCADDAGRNAWPSVSALAAKCNIDVRTARRVLGRLERAGHLIIERGAGRCGTNVYHLLLPVAPRIGARGGGVIHSPGHSARGQNARGGGTPGGETPGEVTQPGQGRGDTAVPGAPGHSRAPRTSVPPVPPPPARDGRTPAAAGPAGGGGGVAEFFAALGQSWPLADAHRTRLVPLAETALMAGWPPRTLAAHVGANPAGVRNAYAVLRTRLAELPAPPAALAATPRPDWCGTCDERTRLRERPDGTAARCPACHPLIAAGAAGSQTGREAS